MTTPLIALALAGAVTAGLVVWWLFRTLYGAPWYLLIGPTDAGKTTLVAGALETASPRKGRAARVDSRDVAWHYFKGGVVIDVAGRLAFPPGGSDLRGWQRVLQLLTRYRPRRPLDGVILAVPARLLLDDNWRVRVLDLGAAVRERFVFAQGRLGFALPVYVVVTQADQVRGFPAVTEALPDHLLQGMLGWSNPHAPDEPFSGVWVDEGMDGLHRSLVHTQVELLASGPNREHASDVFLFPGEVRRLSAPLRALLEEVFRPGLYRDGFFPRGFYLCGATAPRRSLTAGDDRLPDVAALPLHATPVRQVAFIGDLLDDKVFAERDLAIPLPEIVASRQRSRLLAQVACGLLALGLSAGTLWGYWQLQVVQGKVVQLLAASNALLAERLGPAGGAAISTTETRLGQSLGLVDRYVQQLSNDRLSGILFDASLEHTLTRFLGSIVLEDVGASLNARGRTWLDAAVPAHTDPPPDGPDIETSVRYKALADFAQQYALFVQNYARYDTLATGRYQAADDPVAQLGALSQYLDYPLSLKVLAPRYARALSNARASYVPCAPGEVKQWHDLVAARAAALLDDFGTWSFGTQNPVWSSASEFKRDWEAIWLDHGGTPDLVSLMRDTAALSGAVAAWAKLDGRYGDQPIPLFAQAPFQRQPSPDGLCGALSPDLSASIVRVTGLKDALRARLLAEQVDTFGSVLQDREPGLVLADEVAALKSGLDALQRQSFWSPPPDEDDIALPGRPTWRAEALDDVVASFRAFESYRAQAFAGLTLEQRSALLTVVEAQVAQLLATKLALTAEDGSAPRAIDAVTGVAAQFAKLSPVVPLLKLDPVGGDILARLDAEAAEALRVIDRQAKTTYPWVFDQPAQTGVVYARWRTLQATYPPADALKQWAAFADAQRDGIRAFAALAQPFVAYLDASSRGWDTSSRWAGVASWAAIARSVASDDQKLAGSAQNALDAVIREGVPSMVVEKGCAPAGGVAGPATSGFFITAGNTIVAEGQRQCRAQAQADYAAIASAFNGTLQGKFPFLPAAPGAPEATPTEVKNFLEIYSQNHGPALRPLFDSWSCSDDTRSFLSGIDGASALLSSVLTPGLPAPAIVLDIVPDFTVDPALEGSGRDQIEEWQVLVGSKVYSDRTPAAPDPAPWTSGTPVSLAMRFANDSPNLPTAGTGFLSIVGRDVRLQFGGAWAIFQLLQVGRPTPADLLLQPDPAFNLLSFTIPVARDLTRPALRQPGSATAFTVYMRLKVSPRGKPDALRADAFPTRAPASVTCPAPQAPGDSRIRAEAPERMP